MKAKLLASTIAAAALFAGSAMAQPASGTVNSEQTGVTTSAGEAGTTGGPAGGMGDTGSIGGTDKSTTGTSAMESMGGSGSSGATASQLENGVAATDTSGNSQASGSSSSSSSGMSQASSETPTYNGQELDSAQVRKVQQALSQQGQDLEADGVWGPNTAQALRSFQQAENIDATGELDEQTVSALGVDLESEVGMGGSSASTGSGSMSSGSGSSVTGASGMGEGATQTTPGQGSNPSEAQLVPNAESDDAAPVRDLSTASGGN